MIRKSGWLNRTLRKQATDTNGFSHGILRVLKIVDSTLCSHTALLLIYGFLLPTHNSGVTPLQRRVTPTHYRILVVAYFAEHNLSSVIISDDCVEEVVRI